MSDTLNSVLDRLGIYDIVAVFCTGAIIITLTEFVYSLLSSYPDIIQNLPFNDIKIDINENNRTIYYIVFSYVIGVIFQQIGSILERGIFNNDRFLKEVLNAKKIKFLYLDITKEEIDNLNVKLEKDDDYAKLQNHNDTIKYNYCKFFNGQFNDTSRTDRDQSTGAMTRSLLLYFGFLCLDMIGILLLICVNHLVLSLFFVSLILAVLMFFMFRRFRLMRFEKILRGYLYYHKCKEDPCNNGETENG